MGRGKPTGWAICLLRVSCDCCFFFWMESYCLFKVCDLAKSSLPNHTLRFILRLTRQAWHRKARRTPGRKTMGTLMLTGNDARRRRRPGKKSQEIGQVLERHGCKKFKTGGRGMIATENKTRVYLWKEENIDSVPDHTLRLKYLPCFEWICVWSMFVLRIMQKCMPLCTKVNYFTPEKLKKTPYRWCCASVVIALVC